MSKIGILVASANNNRNLGNKLKEIANELKEAKNVLGLDSTESDITIINKAYRNLARDHHPDLGGDLDEFKKINKAHKLIKKEMGL